ncbi:MAG TPA: ATP-binding cassette domain-containing protein, partial [Polyangiaceae bacterium]|nr:ATP-binding cassette domain-containing protein [Polyangiaceae bacterium]
GALSFVVSSYTGLASWHAVVDRLRYFGQAMDRIKVTRKEHWKVTRSDGPELRVSALDVGLPDGRVLVRDLHLKVERGERLLVTGPSGCGKSTLVRAIAGIWPYAEGEVAIPARDRVLFLPQRPYLPLGTLEDVLVYPYGGPVSAADLDQLLVDVHLPQLRPALGDDRMWSHVLSLGEQQRVAFARALLQRPAWLFMDEATAALDEPSEAELYRVLLARLPRTAIVSVGHRSSLLGFHERRLELSGAGHWREAALDRAAG